MKFVFNFVSSYCFSFLFRKSIPVFKRRIIIINLLNLGILFLNRKTSSQIGFDIYLPASPRVLTLLSLQTLHLQEAEILPFKIHMLIPHSFSLNQLSLKYVCFLLFLPTFHQCSAIVISYCAKLKSNQIRTRSQNNEKQTSRLKIYKQKKPKPHTFIEPLQIQRHFNSFEYP